MKRRAFITLLGGAAAAWPLGVHAQQASKRYRIGFLGAGSESGMAKRVEAFRSGLRDLGYVEGTNVVIEARWANERYERLLGLAVELIRSNVDVIVTHGTPGSLAAKEASVTIPIVMLLIGDPIAFGVVPSLARPGEAGDKTKLNRVFGGDEDDGDRRSCRLGRQHHSGTSERGDHGDLAANQVDRKRRQPIDLILGPAVHDRAKMER